MIVSALVYVPVVHILFVALLPALALFKPIAKNRSQLRAIFFVVDVILKQKVSYDCNQNGKNNPTLQHSSDAIFGISVLFVFINDLRAAACFVVKAVPNCPYRKDNKPALMSLWGQLVAV